MNSSNDSDAVSTERKSATSLSELKNAVESENKAIRNLQASHDFYMSVWKSAPYALVASIPAVLYASLIDVYFAAGPLATMAIIAVVGVAGWYRQETLNEDIEMKLNLVSERKKQLERRLIKVEMEFRTICPNNTLCFHENFRFDESLEFWQHSDYQATVVPQILEDMKYYDNDLLKMRIEFDSISNRLIDALKSFNQAAVESIARLNQDAGISWSSDDFAPRIHAIFYVSSNIVGSVADVKPESGRPRVHVSSNRVSDFIELIHGEHGHSNPYPALLHSEQLGILAKNVESLRKQALSEYSSIDQTIRVEYAES